MSFQIPFVGVQSPAAPALLTMDASDLLNRVLDMVLSISGIFSFRFNTPLDKTPELIFVFDTSFIPRFFNSLKVLRLETSGVSVSLSPLIVISEAATGSAMFCAFSFNPA